MSDLEKARNLFEQAGLAFPTIPEELAARLIEQREWLFSTRELKMSPYNLQHYVQECDVAPVEDYTVLGHSGHGVNSYALQYYLVHGALRMFLHLGWGGVYMDAKETVADIQDCFSLADEIVSAVKVAQRLRPSDPLLIVCSDFYGSYWSAPGEGRREADRPVEVLAEVLEWLRSLKTAGAKEIVGQEENGGKGDMNMTIDSVSQQVGKHHGKGGWPVDLTYNHKEEADSVEVIVGDAGSAKDGVWKRIDPWGFAYFHEIKKEARKPVRLTFSLRSPNTRMDGFQYEALKRRLSYLAEANHFQITLLKGSLVDPLYSRTDATNRVEKEEKVRGDFKHRRDNTPGNLEKDFQTWLFGKGLYRDTDSGIPRTNERLALFGPDFVGIGKITSAKNQNGYKVEREFPTGAFKKAVKEANRILSTEFVDLVTLNKNGDLAVIEIKFDDNKLEVIPQVLNYALFFHTYRSYPSGLTELLDKKLACATAGRKLVTYLVSNAFHDRFESVWPYYSRGQGPLTIKRVIMGHMPDPELGCD